jgi:dienelactone hydrolase
MAHSYSTTRDSIEFVSRGLKILGVIHRGTDPASRACPGVVMYHGFMASKCQPPHRLFVQLAEVLARLGIVSLRIDLPGRGDSEGDSIDMTVEGDLAAAQQAIDVLAAQPDVDGKRIGLVGISWGGTLAATLAGRDPRVAATVLLSTSPYEQVNWKPRFQKIEGRRVYKFVGNLVGDQFFAGMKQLHPVDDLAHTGGPVAYIYGTKDRLVDSVALENLQQRLMTAGVPLDVIPIADGDHVFFAPASQRQAIDATVTWIQRALHSQT